MVRIVIDTNIIVSAILNKHGAPRSVLRLALQGKVQPVIGNALFAEYESVMGRTALIEKSTLSSEEVADLFNAILSVSEWTSIYYLWRPNLRDEADNHLIELAMAGNASTIVTANKADFRRTDLLFPDLRILTAGEFLKERKPS